MSSDEESVKSGAEELKEEEYVVEKVLDEKIVDGSSLFYIKWRGYPDSENTWEPEENCDCRDLITAFRAAKKKKQPEKKTTTKKKQPGPSSTSTEPKKTFNKTTTKKRKRIDESGSDDEPVVISDSEEDGKSKRKRGRQVTTSRPSSKPKKPLSDDEVEDDFDEDEDENEEQNGKKSKQKSKDTSEEEELLYSDYSATSEKVKQVRDTKKEKSSTKPAPANRTSRKSTSKNEAAKNDDTDDETAGSRADINSLDDESMENGLEPEKIIGATEVSGELYYLIKWKNMNKADLISAKICQLGCPQTVIAFLTERLSWEGHLSNDTPTNATTTTTPSAT